MQDANVIYSIILGGTASSALTEMLKLPFIPIAAQKYPRITAAILSVLSALVAFWVQHVPLTGNVGELAATAAGAFLVSAITYKQALQGLQTEQVK